VQKAFTITTRRASAHVYGPLFDYGGGPPAAREMAAPMPIRTSLSFALSPFSLEAADASRRRHYRSARCDVGAIWLGLRAYTGGPISMIDTTRAAFVQRCEALAAKHGERFKPNKLLRDMASKGEPFTSASRRARKQPRAGIRSIEA